MQKTKEIIDYFYKLEFLSPYYPNSWVIYNSDDKTEFDFVSLKSKKKNDKEKKKTVYSFYVGDFLYDEATKELAHELNLKYLKDNETTSCVAIGFKVDEKGHFCQATFGVSYAIYAINKMLENKSANIDFLEDEAIKLVNKIEGLQHFSLENAQDFMEELIPKIKEIFPFVKDYIKFACRITKEEIYIKDDEEVITPAILPSFYLQDLKYLRSNINPKIESFLSLKRSKSIEIDKDIEEMKKALNPLNYPLGKWPSKYKPCLMQQIAINLFKTIDNPVFSVNGPPGSGKTTMIKETIADIVVKRAIVMCSFDEPDDAFVKTNIEQSGNYYYNFFYKLDERLNKFGILVASNNNAAVENISLELPLAKDVKISSTLTNFFDTDINEEVYFTDLACSLNDKENWGMISAPLGKSANIKKFNNVVWFSKDFKTLKDYCNSGCESFLELKLEFLQKLEEVKKYQKFLSEVQNDVIKSEKITAEIKSLKEKYNKEKKELDILAKEKEKMQDEILEVKKNISINQELLKEIESKISWYVKLLKIFFKNNPYIVRIRNKKNEILELDNHYFDLKEKMILFEIDFKKQENVVHDAKEKLEKKNKMSKDLEEKIKNYKNEHKIVIADSKYFKDITKNLDSQESNPWTNEIFDKLREELFYLALKIHKSFILNSNGFKRNLNIVVDAFSNSLDEHIRNQCYKDLLNTLFLFVPVISTSLASVQKFLANINEDDIEYLIIDEAGQATIASVLGAINRVKKTIVLGDPLQVKPVVATPKAMYNIMNNSNINDIFVNNELSTQTVADMQNIFGGARGEYINPYWIGCPLVLHRRCINPMFTISNKIAYENRMFYCTKDKSSEVLLSLDESCWFDIGGEEKIANSHYVEEQGIKVIQLLEQAFMLNKSLPDMYIISPFKTVAHSLYKEINDYLVNNSEISKKEINDWLKTHCGTIHTFQGKEANEVIIVLGCSSKSKGAIKWAASEPNILNVAVSRAKYRVAIIGEAKLWKNVNYFDIAYKYLFKK